MFTIPESNLPPGFADRLKHPTANPSTPVPAATIVLLRDGASGPEVLLLQRHGSSGFVPGAYVFPGGRVDEADGDSRLLERAVRLPESGPEPAFWMAALREAFEETGALPACGRAVGDRNRWRKALLRDEAVLLDVLEALRLELDFRDVVHLAHWITPEPEPRRYDTHFFLARWPDGESVEAHAAELTDALWATPMTALDRFRAGRLPMIFPTVHTLESLTGFDSVAAALEAFRDRTVRPIRPRLVHTADGVGIVVDD